MTAKRRHDEKARAEASKKDLIHEDRPVIGTVNDSVAQRN